MEKKRFFDSEDIGSIFDIDDKHTLIGKLSIIGSPVMVRLCTVSNSIQIIHFNNGKYLKYKIVNGERKFLSNGGRTEYLPKDHSDYVFYKSQLEAAALTALQK